MLVGLFQCRHHGRKIQPVLILQGTRPGFQLVKAQRMPRCIAQGKRGHIAVGFGRQHQYPAVKGVAHGIQVLVIARVPAPQVDRQHAALAKGHAAIVQEGLGHHGRDDVVAVKGIDQDGVEGCRLLPHVIHPVTSHHLHASVGRQAEHRLAQRHHLRIKLHGHIDRLR